MKFSKETASYIAGFLDGDGSIYVKLTRNPTYRFGFQVAPYIVFYQSLKGRSFLGEIRRLIGGGYIRVRKDGIAEYIIGDTKTLKTLLKALLPHLRLKKRQALLMLEILRAKANTKSAGDFIRLSRKIDRFKELNYSKNRSITTHQVREFLRQRRLTP